MKEDFIASAHRHRAKADVAVTLQGWADWTDAQILDAVEDLVALTDPHERLQNLSMATLRTGLPMLLDPPRKNGLTVNFEGYSGRGMAPDADRIVAISARLADALADRGVALNLLIDPPLVEDRLSGGLMDDLQPLFAGGSVGFDRILVFLERPTTDAKKIIRFRMENGVYRGAVRRELLRRIMPVLPPGGHRGSPSEPSLRCRRTA